MRKRMYQLLLVIAIAIVWYRYYVITQPQSVELKLPQKDIATDSWDQNVSSPFDTQTWTETVDQTGIYTNYSEPAVQNALNNGEKVVLFFYASRDPISRQLDQDIIKNLKQLPADVSVFKVDYDTENILKQKYGVKTQQTFVMIDADWNKLNVWVWLSFQTLLNLTK